MIRTPIVCSSRLSPFILTRRLQFQVRSFATAMATPSKRALLLLPPPPAPSSYPSLKAAYHAPLFIVLKELANVASNAQRPALLEIALPCPALYGKLNLPRGPLYSLTQQLVANIYKLICVTAAKESIGTEDAEGVDARVILLAYPRDGELKTVSEASSPEEEAQGPAINLSTLAHSSRRWDTIYSVESEQGERLLQQFSSYSRTGTPVSRVRGGIVQVDTSGEERASAEHTGSKLNHLAVAVGGTFDHLHIGHKLLLTMFAFVLGRNPDFSTNKLSSTLTIGITGDALLKNKKYAEHLESWKSRQTSTHDFLSSIVYFGQPDDSRIKVQEIHDPGPNGHAVHVRYPNGLALKYVEIWDPFGPTITDKEISALALSLETRSGGAAVNSKRGEQGWEPLQVFEVAVLDASEEDNVDDSFQSKLSSTEIRRRRSEKMQPRAKA